MSTEQIATQLTTLLTDRPPDSALRCLHYATRILTHRRRERKHVPWLADVSGEPDNAERALAERIIRSVETQVQKPVTEWDDAVAATVAELLFATASRLTTARWGYYDRDRARQLLSYCRAEPYRYDWSGVRDWLRSAQNELTAYALSDEDVELLRARLRGSTWSECAQSLNIDDVSVKQRYARALRKLIEAAAGE